MFLRHAMVFGYAMFAMSSVSFATPKEVLILRHAEKPAPIEGIHLSERGLQRANALAGFFLEHPDMIDNGPAVAVFAAAAKSAGGSVRPFETISPTADRLGVSVIRDFRAGDESAIADEVLNNPIYAGKTVIICWVHDSLPSLAQAFGINAKLKWPSPVFDIVWKISYDRKGTPKPKTVPQRLLAGDH